MRRELAGLGASASGNQDICGIWASESMQQAGRFAVGRMARVNGAGRQSTATGIAGTSDQPDRVHEAALRETETIEDIDRSRKRSAMLLLAHVNLRDSEPP